jgi:hypothetical protein
MRSVLKSKFRLFSVLSLLILQQCCCCILPVRWQVQKDPPPIQFFIDQIEARIDRQPGSIALPAGIHPLLKP